MERAAGSALLAGPPRNTLAVVVHCWSYMCATLHKQFVSVWVQRGRPSSFGIFNLLPASPAAHVHSGLRRQKECASSGDTMSVYVDGMLETRVENWALNRGQQS